MTTNNDNLPTDESQTGRLEAVLDRVTTAVAYLDAQKQKRQDRAIRQHLEMKAAMEAKKAAN